MGGNTNLTYILARLGEPSTWAGIAVILGLFGVDFVQGTQWPELVKGGAAFAAALAVLFKEKAPAPGA